MLLNDVIMPFTCLVNRYNLAKAQVKQGKLIVIESRLKEQEQQLERQKIAIATNRQRKENKAVQRTIRTLATEQRLVKIYKNFCNIIEVN